MNIIYLKAESNLKKITSDKKLSPESINAIKQFSKHLIKWEQYYIRSINDSIIENNKFVFLSGKIIKKNLYHDSYWTWNQSTSKNSVVIDDKYELRLYKYNTLLKDKSKQKISYKLWLGNINVISTNETFSFIWCERGKISCDSLKLSDFSFLAEFVTPAVRLEFGWTLENNQ